MRMRNKILAGISAFLFGLAGDGNGLEAKPENAAFLPSDAGYARDARAILGFKAMPRDTLADKNEGQQDSLSTKKKEVFTWELVNDILPRYEGDSRIFLGGANEDSLYNKCLTFGKWRVVFGDYRDLNVDNLMPLSPEQDEFIRKIYRSHLRAKNAEMHYEAPEQSTFIFSDSTRAEILSRLPKNFESQTLSEALLSFARVLAEKFTYAYDDLIAIQMDRMSPEEIWNSGEGVCRHYTPLLLTMFNSVKGRNQALRKFTMGVANTAYTEHSADVLAARSKFDENLIVATLVDPTWYDTKVENAQSKGRESKQSLDDIFGAFDTAHANDFALMQPFLEGSSFFTGNLGVKDVCNDFYLRLFRISTSNEANYFLAGAYIFEKLSLDEKIDFLTETMGKKSLRGDEVKYLLTQLQFERGDLDTDSFLREAFTFPEYRQDALSRAVSNWYEHMEYERIGKLDMGLFKLGSVHASKSSSIIEGFNFSFISFSGGGELIMDLLEPDLAMYVASVHNLYLKKMIDRERVIGAYRRIYQQTQETLKRCSSPVEFSKSHRKALNRIGSALEKNEVPKLKDLKLLYFYTGS